MELYKVPNHTKVRIKTAESPPPGGIAPIDNEVYMYHHCDGMYSLCVDKHAQIVHLKAWTDVEIVE